MALRSIRKYVTQYTGEVVMKRCPHSTTEICEAWSVRTAQDETISLLSAKNDLLTARMDVALAELDEMITSFSDNEVEKALRFLKAILSGKLGIKLG